MNTTISMKRLLSRRTAIICHTLLSISVYSQPSYADSDPFAGVQEEMSEWEEEESIKASNDDEWLVPAAVAAGAALLWVGYTLVKKASGRSKNAGTSRSAPAADTWTMSGADFMNMSDKERHYATFSHLPKDEIEQLWQEKLRNTSPSDEDPYA